MAEEGAQLEVLSAEECRRLLAGQQVGRLGVVAEHYPLIVPVTYAMDEHVVVVGGGGGFGQRSRSR